MSPALKGSVGGCGVGWVKGWLGGGGGGELESLWSRWLVSGPFFIRLFLCTTVVVVVVVRLVSLWGAFKRVSQGHFLCVKTRTGDLRVCACVCVNSVVSFGTRWVSLVLRSAVFGVSWAAQVAGAGPSVRPLVGRSVLFPYLDLFNVYLSYLSLSLSLSLQIHSCKLFLDRDMGKRPSSYLLWPTSLSDCV